MQYSLSEKSALIKEEALRLGFDACGIAPAGDVGEDRERVAQWLAEGNHGEMSYMANYFDKRCNPALLVEGAQSVIALAHNYYPQQKQAEHLPQIATYAYGKDYHEVVKQKLFTLMEYIHREIEPVEGRAFVDSAPVLERYWAKRAGLGWIGKNNLLIIPGKGSFFFLSELILNIELTYDEPYTESHCGQCTRCANACPTGALSKHKLDARKCLSYLTIEKKGEFSPETETLHNRLYGCDICQQVCPWNRFSTPHQTPEFLPESDFLQFDISQWQNLSEKEFHLRFRHSPIKRTGFAGIQRNAGKV